MLLVRKDAPQPQGLADVIDQLAAKFEPRLARAFAQAAAQLTDQASIEALAAAVEQGNTEAIYALLGVPSAAAIAAPFQSLSVLLQQVAQTAGEAAMGHHSLGSATVAFNLLNPNTVQHLQSYTYNLVSNITAEVRAGIKEALGAGIASGRGPIDVARDVRAVAGFGLTAQQARAVANYRTELETMDRAKLLAMLRNDARLLRDQRYDAGVRAALEGKAPLTKARIEKMVERYLARMLKHRAENIARTEAIRAANIGAYQSMLQAAEANAIPIEGIVRRWLVAKDERVCPTCKAIPPKNPQGVGMKQPFTTAFGPVMLPPAHMICRCTVTYRLRAEAIDNAA